MLHLIFIELSCLNYGKKITAFIINRNMSLLVVAYFGYPPQYRMVDLHLCPDDFWNFSPYAFWLCT